MVAVLVVAGAAALAVAVTIEVADRRSDGFCRRSAGSTETRTWWPIGERCTIRAEDGSIRVREPGWWLTLLVGTFVAGTAAGVAATARSARRRAAEALVVPMVPLSVFITVVVSPRSLSRLVAIATISLALTAVPAALTALGVRHLLATTWRAAVAVSWLAWAAAVFYAGRGGVAP